MKELLHEWLRINFVFDIQKAHVGNSSNSNIHINHRRWLKSHGGIWCSSVGFSGGYKVSLEKFTLLVTNSRMICDIKSKASLRPQDIHLQACDYWTYFRLQWYRVSQRKREINILVNSEKNFQANFLGYIVVIMFLTEYRYYMTTFELQ